MNKYTLLGFIHGMSKTASTIPKHLKGHVGAVLGSKAVRGGVLRPESTGMSNEEATKLLERSGLVSVHKSRFPGLPPVVRGKGVKSLPKPGPEDSVPDLMRENLETKLYSLRDRGRTWNDTVNSTFNPDPNSRPGWRADLYVDTKPGDYETHDLGGLQFQTAGEVLGGRRSSRPPWVRGGIHGRRSKYLRGRVKEHRNRKFASKTASTIPKHLRKSVEGVLSSRSARGGVLRPESIGMSNEEAIKRLNRSGLVSAHKSRFPGLPPVVRDKGARRPLQPKAVPDKKVSWGGRDSYYSETLEDNYRDYLIDLLHDRVTKKGKGPVIGVSDEVEDYIDYKPTMWRRSEMRQEPKTASTIPKHLKGHVGAVLGSKPVRGGALKPESVGMSNEEAIKRLNRSGLVSVHESRFPGLPPVVRDKGVKSLPRPGPEDVSSKEMRQNLLNKIQHIRSNKAAIISKLPLDEQLEILRRGRDMPFEGSVYDYALSKPHDHRGHLTGRFQWTMSELRRENPYSRPRRPWRRRPRNKTASTIPRHLRSSEA